ncbi:hypothetical protein GW765_03120 [Candidatus Parcubacteria bacterium]|nr:hypothetical protein [Candidatus Parcubacteria bacterium]
MKKYTFHVSGTHCPSCKILIEDILMEQDFIKSTKVDLKKEIIDIELDNEKSENEILLVLNDKLKSHNYVFSNDKLEVENKNSMVFWKALPIGVSFLVLFFLLQKSGILNFGINGEITPITSLLIGLVASVSSCLAIVGGLVLSLSAKISQDDVSDTKTFILFHGGRLVGFAVLGGLLGLAGKAIGINYTFSVILGLVASVIMIMLGLNLIGVFKNNKITLPSNIFGFFRKIEHTTLAPILVGVGTFFLPCGFTQSMQFSALSSGSFSSGLLIMLFFALGTLPVLLALSFGSASLAHSKHAPLFFKSAGVVVVGLGLFALIGGLVSLGIINPFFNI